MRPDDASPAFNDRAEAGLDMPFDADLEALDEELLAAGEQARQMLYGRSHPTRVFAMDLRARLLAQLAPQAEL